MIYENYPLEQHVYPMGEYIQPVYNGLNNPRRYYSIRYSKQSVNFVKGDKALGLQILIKFLDNSLAWINVNESWLIN